MPEPKNAFLPLGVGLVSVNGSFEPTDGLVELLVSSRNEYDWPSGTGARESQQTIIKLEDEIAELMCNLDVNGAHAIVCFVSRWAGNNANSHAAIVNANTNQKEIMQSSLCLLSNPATVPDGLDLLVTLPGLRLVIASKVYRFIAPQIGASVDRHASYFFNSLPIESYEGNNRSTGTTFCREWSTRKHTTSRLSIYSNGGYTHNRNEYVQRYLPLLRSIATYLNQASMSYTCAATNNQCDWRPTDVEMAAYYWWASNGVR